MSDYEENGNGNSMVPITALHSIRETQTIVETAVTRNKLIDAAVKAALDNDEVFQSCLPYLAPNGGDAGGKYQAHTIVALLVRTENPDGFKDVTDLTLKELWGRVHKYLANQGMVFVNGFVTEVRTKNLAAA